METVEKPFTTITVLNMNCLLTGLIFRGGVSSPNNRINKEKNASNYERLY